MSMNKFKSTAISARTVFIHTVKHDGHAKIISYVLSKRGHKVIKWFGENYPTRSKVSVEHNGTGSKVDLCSGSECFNASEVDVVWNRRRMAPVAPPGVHADDRGFVAQELQVAAIGHDIYFDHAFWINNYSSLSFSELKMMQFVKAQDIGLSLPSTLISNDPCRIREFVGRFDKCIYKPLTGYEWSEDGRKHMTYTALVSQERLPDDCVLQATPGIFQKFIEKTFEVRVQFFGAYYAGVKIESRKIPNGHLDWRIGQGSIESCESIVLPIDIYNACRKLMRELDIVSGGFDFIVDKHGDWIFLEVNEAGQFLFIEDWCNELHLLDAFCQFIEKSDTDFTYTPTNAPIKLTKACEMAASEGLFSATESLD